MKKSLFLFSLTLLFSLSNCFTTSRCNVGASSSATTTTTTMTTTTIRPTSPSASYQLRRPMIHGMTSDNILANVVNASLMNVNETGDASNGLIFDLERNASDTSIDDDHFGFRWEHLRERKKQQRLFTIQNRIKDLLGAPRRPNITTSHISDIERRRMAQLLEILQTHQQAIAPHDVTAERVQSFYPSCTLPRNTDRELWEDPGLFHVFYDIPSPLLSQSTSLTVSSAKLRLYKTAVESVNDCEEQKQDDDDVDRAREFEDYAERLRISIFQYVRPLRRNRRLKKKKLVDSRMVSANYGGWLDFDVGSSIRDWLENSSKNLGLEIVLEDVLANPRNPSEYLHNMNCTEGKDRPFPHFTEEITSTPSDQNETSLIRIGSETYPTLDLRTIEVVEAENASTIKKNELNRRRKRQTTAQDDDDIVVVHTSQDDCDSDSLRRSSCCAINLDVSFKGNATKLNCVCCCIFSFNNVTIKELGFDGIVAPESFRTKVCVGVCGLDNDESNDTDEKYEDRTMLNLTCAPSHTEPLVLLHFNENGKLKIRTITDVIIKSCSCMSSTF